MPKIIPTKTKAHALALAYRLRSEGKPAFAFYTGRYDRSRGVLTNVTYYVKVKHG